MKPPISGAALPPQSQQDVDAAFLPQQKTWQQLLALKGEGLGLNDYELLYDLLERNRNAFTPIAFAELIICVGKIGAPNHDSLDGAGTTLLQVVDRLEMNIDWMAVFQSIPLVDSDLKINSLECFAFIVEMHRRRCPHVSFPIEIGFSKKWKNRLCQALFLKWVVIAAAVSTTGTYMHVPFLAYLRGIEIPADNALIATFPPVFLSQSASRMWSNGELLAVVLDLADEGAFSSSVCPQFSSGTDSDEVEAARIAFELLKRPTMNSPEILLATLVKSIRIPASVARSLAVECLEHFWKREQQQQSPQEVSEFYQWMINLNPARFSTVVIGALYTSAPEKIADVVSVMTSAQIPAVLDGPPAPFKFHVAHLAWSAEFNPAAWLKERLIADETNEMAKEFLLFLILSLCPLDVLHQKLPPGTSHPMRRLHVRPQELWLYLATIVGNSGQPDLLPAMLCDRTMEQLLDKPKEVLNSELGKLKQACARLLPQLAGFVLLIQPAKENQAQQTDEATDLHAAEENFSQRQLTQSEGSKQQQPLESDATEAALQQEVHRYFVMLYTNEISSEELLDLMKSFSKSPPGSHNFQIFSHMVKLLFHECRFFPKYPHSELAVTAQLMGQMIHDEILVGHGPHGTGHLLAIRCVLEALRKGEGSKMFRFGVTALEQFADTRMASCPDFLEALATSLPDVRKHFPAYVEYAEQCLAVMSPELRRSHYIEMNTLLSLPLPPPPAVIVHPDFSLSVRNVPENYSVQPAASTGDGLPGQRPLLLNGRPVSLGGFSLGSVERLLSSDPALITGIVEPPSWFQDRISQIFNSLVLTNVDQKAEDLRDVLQPEWIAWLSLYIVKSRAIKETNLHVLYVQLLERIGWPKLVEHATVITYEAINVLLSYVDAAKEESSYRTVLKNLGSWLGNITLARNVPLRSKSVDLKMLLFDGYENGRLKALLPLVCKIIEGVGQSRSFRPPNPWSVAIFNLLAEIHSLPGLITALVFEIEVLFKHLNMQVSEFRGRTSHLARRNPPPANSGDFTVKKTQGQPALTGSGTTPTAATPTATNVNNLISSLQNRGAAQTAQTSVPYALQAATRPTPIDSMAIGASKFAPPNLLTPGVRAHMSVSENNDVHANELQSALASDASLIRAFEPIGMVSAAAGSESKSKVPPATLDGSSTLLAGLTQSVAISPALALFQLKPALEAIVPHALERAIKEIVQIVAERSVTISCVATKEIVCKDFAAEASESLIRRAAHLMVASLAGSLTLVTCREPLRAAMCQHLRTLLLAASEKLGEDQRLVDQVVGVVAADNTDLGCSLVEQSVIQRALQEIETTIQRAILLRRQDKGTSSSPFLDEEYYNRSSRWPAALPDGLRPKAALTGEQLQVYKDFLSFGPLRRMQVNSAPGTNATTALNGLLPGSDTGGSVPASAVFLTTSSDAGAAASEEGETTFLARVEGALSQVKDIVHEVAFCYPVLSVKVTPHTRFCSPLGSQVEALDVPHCVNPSLSILCRLPSCHEVFSAVLVIPSCCATTKNPETAMLTVCQRVIRMINDAGALYRQHQLARGTDVAGLYLEVFLAILSRMTRLEDFPHPQLTAELLNWLPQTLNGRRFGTDVVIGLLRYKLLSCSQIDKVLVEQAVASFEKRDTVVFENLIKILHRIATQTVIRFPDVKEALQGFNGCRELISRISIGGDANETLHGLLARAVVALDSGPQFFEDARQTVLDAITAAYEVTEKPPPGPEELIVTFTELLDNYASLGSPVVRVRRLPAPCAVIPERQKVFAQLFDQWTICALVVGSDRRSKVWAEFFQTLSKQRFLQMDDDTDRFFGGCIDRAIELASQPLGEPSHNSSSSSSDTPPTTTISVETPPELEWDSINIKPVDALSKMVVAMMRLIDPSQISPVLILQRALSAIARSIHRDSELSLESLPQKLYYRLLLSLIWEVGQPGRGLDSYAIPCLLYFASTYQVLNPCECPAFVFCWLELISHRCFMPKMLRHLRGWPHYHRLLSGLFRFLYPLLNKGYLTEGVQSLYKGIVRLLLVLLHDFPEFLCEYHIDVCEQLPFNAIQLRNLILSAFPRNMKLPDPFTPNLEINKLPDSRKLPHLATRSVVFLLQTGVQRDLHHFWKTEDTMHLDLIIQKLKLTDHKIIKERGTKYNLSLLNSLLLDIISHGHVDQLPYIIGSSTIMKRDEAIIEARALLYILLSLDHDGQYVLISLITNQLRYPNLHTSIFSSLLLWCFYEVQHYIDIQEQITTVLLERLIAHRPHPWGLLLTFIDLIRNPIFEFWTRSFVHAAPEVQKLFHSVAQTCLGHQQPSNQINREPAIAASS